MVLIRGPLLAQVFLRMWWACRSTILALAPAVVGHDVLPAPSSNNYTELRAGFVPNGRVGFWRIRRWDPQLQTAARYMTYP